MDSEIKAARENEAKRLKLEEEIRKEKLEKNKFGKLKDEKVDKEKTKEKVKEREKKDKKEREREKERLKEKEAKRRRNMDTEREKENDKASLRYKPFSDNIGKRPILDLTEKKDTRVKPKDRFKQKLGPQRSIDRETSPPRSRSSSRSKSPFTTKSSSSDSDSSDEDDPYAPYLPYNDAKLTMKNFVVVPQITLTVAKQMGLTELVNAMTLVSKEPLFKDEEEDDAAEKEKSRNDIFASITATLSLLEGEAEKEGNETQQTNMSINSLEDTKVGINTQNNVSQLNQSENESAPRQKLTHASPRKSKSNDELSSAMVCDDFGKIRNDVMLSAATNNDDEPMFPTLDLNDLSDPLLMSPEHV